MRKIFLIISIHVLSISLGTSQRIESDTKEYFQCESYKKCENIWKKYRVGYENTIATALKRGYGHQTMNVYIKRPKDALLLSTGYYHSDNQVEILFQQLLLEEFPYMINPEISFDLCGNALSIESTLSKMIIHSDYFLFRNKSDIIYASNNQDPFGSSPFRFQQVQNTGQIAITVEKCTLTGTVLTKLDGHTVNVGIDMLRLKSCEFNIDVYAPGQKTPPVVASYLFYKDNPNEKNILVQALSKELMPQLQAVLFAHVNTSAIFNEGLFNITQHQKFIMAEVESYIDNVLRQINIQNIEQNMGTVDLDNFSVKWNDAFDGTEKYCEINITGVTMSGLDSAYSAHIGGPYKIEGMPVKIAERVRMGNIKVVGVITLRGMYEGDYNFAADIYDADIDIILEVETLDQKLKGIENNERQHKFVVGGWRILEFSCPDLEDLPIEEIVTGYLRAKLPEHLAAPFSNVYKQAVSNYLDNGKHKENVMRLESGEQLYDEDNTLASKEVETLVGKDYDKAESDDNNIILKRKSKAFNRKRRSRH